VDEEEDETCPLHQMLDDKMRVGYFRSYLAEVSNAIRLAAYISFFQNVFLINRDDIVIDLGGVLKPSFFLNTLAFTFCSSFTLSIASFILELYWRSDTRG